MYRIINKPVSIPDSVKVTQSAGLLKFKGAKGETELSIPDFLKIAVNGNTLQVSSTEDKSQIIIGATYRQLIANKITGISVGFKKTLILEGIGFKVSVSGSSLNLQLGFSHPVKYDFSSKVKIAVDGNKIMIESAEKDLLGQTTAEIRRLRPPEPYKGKGIRYDGEVILRKAGKTSKK